MKTYKDPAFLFYPESFLVGVMDMTDEEIGQYIKLMCRQHQKGHLPKSVIEKASPAVQEKFVKDDKGKYYNVRLETEIEKRARYTASRRRNLEGKKKDEPKDEPKPTKKKETLADWVEDIIPEELQDTYIEWVRMRVKKKKPITSRTTVVRSYNQLKKLSPRIDVQKRIIEQSIDCCWQSFYELKTEQRPIYHKPAEKQKEINAVPMPDEVKEKAQRLGIKIGG